MHYCLGVSYAFLSVTVGLRHILTVRHRTLLVSILARVIACAPNEMVMKTVGQRVDTCLSVSEALSFALLAIGYLNA